MRVLIYENCHLGHHYLYVQHMLPALIETGAEVVVSISAEGRKSEEFRDRLLPFVNQVEFDCQALNANPAAPLSERMGVFRSFADAVKRTRADYTLVPTADALTMAMALSRVTSLGLSRTRFPGEACLHMGLGRVGGGLKLHLRDAVKALTIALSRWDVVHIVNVLFYESLQGLPERIRRRIRLLPDPIAPNPRLPKDESRRRLGLPTDGRYVGIVGSLDPRKAIPELLLAFKAAVNGPGDRLLLAGKLHPPFRRLIDEQYPDLVLNGQVQILDRYLSQEEIFTALTAVDVVCTPYPGFGNLSATLLNAVSAGRPILTHNFGWSKAVVERFKLGWFCNVRDVAEFSRTMRYALEDSQARRESAEAGRLLAFHSPENFATSWLKKLTVAMNIEAYEVGHTWNWVLS
jgi:glycosyltransferase involved in cell wall biosynthesis